MFREDWTQPRGDRIGRSLNPQPTGGTADGRKKTKRALTLLACAAAALVFLSGAVLVSVGDRGESAEQQPEVPGDIADTIPDPPYVVCGYTYAADGATKLPDCAVTITNTNVTSGWSIVVSSGAISFYYYDIGVLGYTVGDTIHVEAVKGENFGENEGVVGGGNLVLDITLSTVIPEFPLVMIPVVGTVALLFVIRHRRKA